MITINAEQLLTLITTQDFYEFHNNELEDYVTGECGTKDQMISALEGFMVAAALKVIDNGR